MKKKTCYCISKSDYMFDGPEMSTIKAKSDEDALKGYFGWEEEKEDWEGGTAEDCGYEPTWEGFLEAQKDANGDGQAHTMIMNCDTQETIFGAE